MPPFTFPRFPALWHLNGKREAAHCAAPFNAPISFRSIYPHRMHTRPSRIRIREVLQRLTGETIFAQTCNMSRTKALEIANMILIEFKMHRLMIEHRPSLPDKEDDGSPSWFKR